MRPGLIGILLLLFNQSHAQQASNQPDSNQQAYLAALKIAGKEFTKDFYTNYAATYSLAEKPFIAKIDSARKHFIAILEKYRNKFDTNYIREQQVEIKYYFDKLLIEYPLNHGIYVDNTLEAISTIPQKLKSNLADFNNPELLDNSDFTNYVKAFLSYQTDIELKKVVYKNSDNKQLAATWELIPLFFSDSTCRSFWQFDYLYNHIDNNGIKNIQPIYRNFTSTCRNITYLHKVDSLYSEDSTGRRGHLIKTYKTAGSFDLDIHMFLPDSILNGGKGL